MFGWKKKVKDAAAKGDSSLAAVLDELPEELDDKAPHLHIHTEGGKTSDAKKDDEEEEDEEKGKTTDARLKKVEDAVDSISKDVKKMKDAFEKKKDDEEDDEEEKKKAEDENRKIEGALEEEAPPGTGDKAAKAKDSSFLAESWAEAVSLAEIISPGYKPSSTFDSATDPKKTLDKLCQFRRSVLDIAAGQAETRAFMDSVTAGKDYHTFDCNGMRTLFRAVGVHKKNLNNRTQQTSDATLHQSGNGVGTKLTPVDINKRNSDFYKTQQY